MEEPGQGYVHEEFQAQHEGPEPQAEPQIEMPNPVCESHLIDENVPEHVSQANDGAETGEVSAQQFIAWRARCLTLYSLLVA